jgi:hypothetical protein
MRVKLVGGPMTGRFIEVEDGTEEHKVFTWKYQWTNSRENDAQVFVLVPRSRAKRRGIKWFIEKFGVHPALHETKTVPYRDPGAM